MDKLRKAIRLFDFPDVIAKVGSSAADAASASSAFLLRGGKSTSDDLDSGHHQGKLKEGEKRNSSFWFSPRTPRKPLEGKQTEGAAATSPLATGTPVVQVTDPPKPAPVEMTIVNIMTDPLPYIPPPIQTASGSDVPLPAPSGLRSRTPSSAPKAEMTTLLSAMNSPAGGSSPSESATVTHLPVTLSKTASSTAPRPVDNAPPVHPSGTLGRAASTTPPAPTADNIAKSSAIRASALKKLNPFVQLFKEFTSAQYTKLTVNLDISNDKQARKLANQLHMSLAGAKDKEITPHDFATYVNLWFN